MRQIFLLLLILPFSTLAQQIDSQNSQVSFEVSNLLVNVVKGNFNGLTGHIHWGDSTGSAQLDICLEAATVNTGNPKRDAHLRQSDFFHVERFPKICFRSSKISERFDGGYAVLGILSMNGFERQMEIPIYRNEETVIAEFSIDRLGFDLGEEYGRFTIGQEVKVFVRITLR